MKTISKRLAIAAVALFAAPIISAIMVVGIALILLITMVGGPLIALFGSNDFIEETCEISTTVDDDMVID